MKYLLLPYNQHCDDGLGAMGDEFKEAGKIVSASKDMRLPQCYLFRHAIELYLKSAVVILHRSLKIPYGKLPYEGVGHIEVDLKWVPIHQTHSIADLWKYLNKVVREYDCHLKSRCQTDWTAIPDGLEEALILIDQLDRSSTFFRYPSKTGEKSKVEKSAWRETEFTEAKFSNAQAKPIKMLLITDDDDQITAAYQYYDDTLEETLSVLEKTANDLTGLHIGLRCELMDGR